MKNLIFLLPEPRNLYLDLHEHTAREISLSARNHSCSHLTPNIEILELHLYSAQKKVLSTDLLYLSHDFVGIPRACGFHRPSEPKRSWFDLRGFIDNIGYCWLASRGQRSIHAHGLALTACASDTQASLHSTKMRLRIGDRLES